MKSIKLSKCYFLFWVVALIALAPAMGSAATVTLYANGVGNFDQWTLGAGASKVAAVSSSDGDTSYINTATLENRQTFGFPGAAVPAGSTINSVTVSVQAKRNAAGGTNQYNIVAEKGTGPTDVSDDSVLIGAGNNYATNSRTMATNPFTSAVWTDSEVNTWGIYFGVRCNAGQVRVTEIYLIVDYTPPAANITPVINRDNATVTVNEGTIATNTGTWSDADAGDTVELAASVGNVERLGTNASGTWSWSYGTTDGPAQSQTVTITANDGTATANTTFTLTVNNVAPTTTFNYPASVYLGNNIDLSLTDPSDPSSDDTTVGFEYAFDCGDGSGYGAFGSSNSTSCSTAAIGTRTVKGKIKDKDGGEREYTGSVEIIGNTPPVIDKNNATVTVNEGATATNTGTWSDADAGDTVELTASVGNVEKSGTNASGTWSWSYGTTDGPAQSQTVTITADDGTDTNYTTFTLTVNNVAPTATFNSPASVYWGNDIDLSLTNPYDPSSVDTTTGFEYAFDCGTGYGSFGSSSSTTCSTTAADIGSRTVKSKIKDKDDGENEYTGTVTVGKRPTRIVYSGDTQAQYSDPVTLAATLTDNGGGALDGDPLSGKTINFVLGSQNTSAVTDADGVASVDLTLLQAPGDSYTVTATFAEDAQYQQSSDNEGFTILPEDATVDYHSTNPVAVQVATPGGSSGEFSLLVDVQELLPDAGCPGCDTACDCPGDIGQASINMKLSPVGPGGPIAGTCIPISVTGGTGYDAILVASCTFDNVPVNVYSVEVEVNGYYTGGAEEVFTVYDPSLGFTTGGGWFYWPGTEDGIMGEPDYYPGDKTNFGYNMKYNKKGKNIQGSLLVIRHQEDETIYRVKSNALDGLSLGENNGYGWASFAGKTTYREPGADTIGNHRFVVYVEDRDSVGESDRFWLQVKDPDGLLMEGMTMDPPAETHAEDLRGGNIVVPHTVSSIAADLGGSASADSEPAAPPGQGKKK